MTDHLTARALREAREVCPGNHVRRHFGAWQDIPPAECACCRRFAVALLRAEARGLGGHMGDAFAFGMLAKECEAAAARLEEG